MSQKRLRFIDSGRGVAMIFVCLSHFSEAYFQATNKIALMEISCKISMIASPTFMIITGMMLGYLYTVKGQDFSCTRRILIDRGLFLITIAHIIIQITFLPLIDKFGSSYMTTFVTDAIGISMIIGTLLISKLSKYYRLMLAALIFSISWFFVYIGKPDNYFLSILYEICFGSVYQKSFFDTFPLVQWLAIYLVGTVLGEVVAKYQLSNRLDKVFPLFMKIGSIGMIIALVFYFVRGHLISEGFYSDFLHITQKNPPGIIYFAFYGSIGIFILALLERIIAMDWFNSIIYRFELIGRTSLFVFVLQYFMYFFILVLIDPPFTVFWPVLFLITIYIVMVASKFWYHKKYNRFITVLNIFKFFRVSKQI